MLLRLRKGLPQSDLDSILLLCKELGYDGRVLDRARQIVELERLPGAGPARCGDASVIGDHAAVVAVLDPGAARERHERTNGAPDTVVAVGDARFGGGHVSLIAGPCAVEDEERLLAIAREVRAAGATVLRGGAFKPRTSPYSFRGLGVDALAMLARARAETGLAIATEVLDPRDLEHVLEVADVLQVGSRNMSNAPLLREVGRADKPVLLKRGLAASVREFLLAAEHVLAEGNERVMLCERGVRGFDHVTRNVLDVGSVAYLKRVTHLPVLVDPSHAAGRPELVRPLARAGIVVGADGLLVEVHTAPCEARSDGAQAVSPAELALIAADADALARLDGRTFVTGAASATAPRSPRPRPIETGA